MNTQQEMVFVYRSRLIVDTCLQKELYNLLVTAFYSPSFFFFFSGFTVICHLSFLMFHPISSAWTCCKENQPFLTFCVTAYKLQNAKFLQGSYGPFFLPSTKQKHKDWEIFKLCHWNKTVKNQKYQILSYFIATYQQFCYTVNTHLLIHKIQY